MLRRVACFGYWLLLTLFLSRLLLFPDDGGDTFLRNVGSFKIHSASHPRIRHSSPFDMVNVLKMASSNRDILSILTPCCNTYTHTHIYICVCVCIAACFNTINILGNEISRSKRIVRIQKGSVWLDLWRVPGCLE
jgi:hypothetical protein